ncbi:heavy metal translocating P-type ATPase, partial [Pseudomonas sp. RIT778]|nr:heavy metal translocating P-type ATPase [Pseudomonas sp. RIT778]
MSDSLHTHKPGDGHDHSHKLQPVHKHAHAGDSCCGSKTVTPAPVHSSEDSCCSSKAAAPSLVQLSEAKSADARLSSFRIEAMDCPTEQTLIQNKLGKLAGIQQLEFNLINRVLGVTHNLPDTAPIIDAIKSL